MLQRAKALSLAVAGGLTAMSPAAVRAQVVLGGTYTSVVNAGNYGGVASGLSITGRITTGTTGVLVLRGLTIATLANSGIVTGGNYGILNSGTIGGLINSGNVTATNIAGIGNSGGQITWLDNTGTIAGDTYGVYNSSSGQIGTLTNNGLINSGRANAIENDGSIGILINGGTISGSHDGVLNEGTIGTLTNNINSTISDLAWGIESEGGIGTLTNDGLINSTFEGIYVGSTINTLINNGTISSLLSAVVNEGMINTLINNGAINVTDAGGTGIGILNQRSIGTLTNNGLISGASFGIENSGSIGTLINTGTISASGSYGVNNIGSIGMLIDAGSIVSAGADVSISSGNPVAGPTLAVENTGTITTAIEAGLYNDASNVTVTNNGMISGGGLSIGGNAADTIVDAGLYNSGTIITLANAGTISGSFGIDNTGSIGTIVNSGLIKGSAFGITGANLTITNSGTIQGGTDAIQFTGGNNALALGGGALNGALDLETGSLDIVAQTTGMTIGSAITLDSAASALTLTPGSTNNLAVGASISGSGSVTVNGSGTLRLAGANSYTGATTINSGATLALSGTGSIGASSGVTDNGTFDISGTSGTSITSLSGTGNVTLGSQTLTLTDANGSFGGTISGTGGLTLAGGTETLTNVSSYTGATTIDSGTTLILSSADDISLDNVVDNGSLLITGTIRGLIGTGSVSVGEAGLVLSGTGGVFAGSITGTGGLTLSTGTQTLTGANTYTGATTIDSGATLALSGTGSVAASSGVTDNGALDISNTTAGASITSLAGTGAVNLGSQTLTLTDAGGTFGGTFSGSGKLLLSGGTGSLILDGNSASFTGTTEIASGLLEVGDINTPSAVLGGNVEVDSAGTLRGHGTVDGSVTNDGTVMPGGSIGTLTVGGNYTQASNATLSIEVSPTAASQLNVSGSATLGGTLAITYDPGTYTATTFTLVSAKSVTGTFSNIDSTGTANLGTLTPSVSVTGTAVDLTLSAASSTAPVVVAPTGTSIYTALGTTAILGAQAQGAALLDQMAHGSTATAAIPDGWVTATGILTKVDGTNGEPGFQANRYGFLTGLDQKLGDYTVGVAAGYDHTDIDESGTGDSGTTDTLRAALYGSRFVGPVNLAATAGVGLDFLSQKRPFGSEGTAEGDHMGQEANVGGQASLPMTFGDVTLTPRLGLRYAYFHANGFGESGAGGQDLTVGTDNVHSLQPYVGVTLDKAFGDASRPTTVQLRAGYARELLDANRTMTVTAQDGTLFAAPGTNLPRGYLTTGVSVTLHPTKSMDVSLNYDTVINTGHASAQQGSVRLGYRF
jgi:fibronectin-binding autotransporter adhesin